MFLARLCLIVQGLGWSVLPLATDQTTNPGLAAKLRLPRQKSCASVRTNDDLFRVLQPPERQVQYVE